MSSDGSAVFGLIDGTNSVARWTPDGGGEAIAELKGTVFGTSADGQVALGFSAETSDVGLWSAVAGFTPLELGLPAGYSLPFYDGLSDDGSTVAGTVQTTDGRRAFRWSAAGGLVTAPDGGLGGNPWNRSAVLSSDGLVMAGSGFVSVAEIGVRWAAGIPPVALGTLPGGSDYSRPKAISADGGVVVGGAGSASGFEAFRWTAGAGMSGLGDLPGGSFMSEATGVSADGSVVIGSSNSGTGAASGSESFVWTEATGMQPLLQVLTNAGVTGLGDWTIHFVEEVSADGTAFRGRGVTRGSNFPWYVKLDAPPGAAGPVVVNGFVDGVWSEPGSWSGGTVPDPADSWQHSGTGGDGTHQALLEGVAEIENLTWASTDTLFLTGWPGNYRQGRLVVNGDFLLGAGTFQTRFWDPRVVFNGPVTIAGGTIGNTTGDSEGGEFFFADGTDVTLTGGTWVFGDQYEDMFPNYKTAVTWGSGMILLDQIALNLYPTFHMVGDTQVAGTNRNAITRSMTGRGGFRKTGPGTLTLVASHDGNALVHDYENITLVDEGELRVEADITRSEVSLAAGASIGGGGSVWRLLGAGDNAMGGALTVVDRFEPGQSPTATFGFVGTSLTLAGATVFDLIPEVPSASSRVEATGGGALVLDRATLSLNVFEPTVGQVFPLFTGFGSVSGEFDGAPGGSVVTTANWDSQGFAVRIDYPGDGVIATIVSPPPPGRTFSEAAAGLPAGADGPTDNADGDPWVNLIEFLLGLDLLASEGEVVEVAVSADGGAGAAPCLVISFPLARDVTGASLSVEVGAGLFTWETVWDSAGDPSFSDPAVVSAAERPDGRFWVSIEVCGAAVDERAFLRLKGTVAE